MQTEPHLMTLSDATPADVLDRVEYNFWAFHRDSGISAERMTLHFPHLARFEDEYQREKSK